MNDRFRFFLSMLSLLFAGLLVVLVIHVVMTPGETRTVERMASPASGTAGGVQSKP